MLSNEDGAFSAACLMQGINEDVATGSAHCIIGQVFAGLLGRTEGIRCWQCSARGGALTLDVDPDARGGTGVITITAAACLRSHGSLSWDETHRRWARA